MSVGLILSGMSNAQRRASYACDIVYGTNNEFGFDYLRDNMVVRLSDVVQRDLNYCIVDEVDSILIDEARTPLIISGQGDKATDLYAGPTPSCSACAPARSRPTSSATRPRPATTSRTKRTRPSTSPRRASPRRAVL